MRAAQTAQTKGVTLAIDSVSPQIATGTSTVVVSGTVTNGTGTALAGLSVELDSTSAQFTSRGVMEEFTDGSFTPGLIQDGDPFDFAGSIPPGGTASWRVGFTSADAGMSGQFGVYGLEAELTDPSGSILGTSATLLPFWPGGSAIGAKLKVAWIWPLIDQPYTQACGWLTSDKLESSLAADGRLDNLLTAGTSDPSAQLTWAVDPALVGDVQTLSSRHEVGPSSCASPTPEPASTAARSWLTSLRAATDSQPVIVTPYANVDVAALVHRGLINNLETAYQLGQEVAEPILSKAFFINIALPAGGLADQSVLTALASPSERIPSVVLGSDEMPLASGEFADNAISSWASGAGTTMSVLLADSTLTDLLKGASTTSESGQFAIEQQFLAETAMIAAEAPNDPRSLVVSPPETWDPSEGLAAHLLSETTSAPWLQPVQLESLTGQKGQVPRRPLQGTSISPRELGKQYLNSVSALDAKLTVYSSILSDPPAGYRTQLAEAVAATESSAWRGGGTAAAQGEALVTGLNQYLMDAEGKVKIIPQPGQISMAGASGLIPVTIQNDLERQAVRVRLVATVVTARGYTDTLTIAQQKVITIPPGQVRLVKLSIRSARQGSTTIDLSLTNANGTVLPWTIPPTQLTINSTRYGQAILILIAGAIGLLLLSSALRSGRRRLSAVPDGAMPDGAMPDGAMPDGPGASSAGSGTDEGPGSGNVMAGAQYLTEAPDDLADARRGADDT